MQHVDIYTDGACSGNPGPGGWAALLLPGDGDVRKLTGGARQTTNNRMEMRAALEALTALDEPSDVTLHTDSAYVSRAFNEGWLANWQKNGWKTSSKKPVKNRDLWEQLLEANDRHDVTWVWVKGHADNEYNNIADELAVAAIDLYR